MHVGLIIIFVSFLFRISLIVSVEVFPLFLWFSFRWLRGRGRKFFLGGRGGCHSGVFCFLPGSRTSMERNTFRCGQLQFSVLEQFVWVSAECKANSHGRKVRQNAHAFHERPSFVPMWPKACSKIGIQFHCLRWHPAGWQDVIKWPQPHSAQRVANDFGLWIIATKTARPTLSAPASLEKFSMRWSQCLDWLIFLGLGFTPKVVEHNVDQT